MTQVCSVNDPNRPMGIGGVCLSLCALKVDSDTRFQGQILYFEARIQLQVVSLGCDPRRCQQGSGQVGRGREGSREGSL